jgi:hypothetical protein
MKTATSVMNKFSRASNFTRASWHGWTNLCAERGSATIRAMRWQALAPLLVATGCNWLYGLDKTIAVDAPISELPPASRTKLVWAIATTDGMPAPPAIDSQLVYTPIGSEAARPQPPLIQVGDDTKLDVAAYDTTDGSFEIPYELRESPHRIVYTLPGESVPHEVQWALTGAYLVVPRTTRLDPAPVPAASGYTITPMGLGTTTTLVGPAIYTSGVFTFSNNGVDFEQSGASITYRFAEDAKPFAGPLGAPQASKGDWVMLGEFESRTTQQSSLRSYALTKIDLQANLMAMPSPEPMWITPTTERTLGTLACPGNNCVPAPPANGLPRLHAVVGAGGDEVTSMAYGVSPSTDLPGFLPGLPPSYVERPLIMPFLVSSRFDSTLTVTDPSAELGLDRVVFARNSVTRMVGAGAVPLTSSLQAITNKFDLNGLPFAAPLATNVMLGSANLSGATDEVSVTASSDIVKLKFAPEATFTADDYVITLYEITGSSLAAVRIYHVIQPEVKISGSLLVSGHHYGFGITARTGFPTAETGDYGKATYPFGASTTFARTFIVQ